MFGLFQKTLYSPVKQSEDVDVRRTNHVTSSASWFGKHGLAVLALVLSFMLGRFWQRNAKLDECQPNIALPLHSHVFRYNQTFGMPPAPASNAAWASMFPEQGGFFKHPDIAPERSAFAVFHQLHCLDAIRQGYWALADHAISHSSEPMDLEKDLPFMISPPHIRHCIDLIRNTLKCRPDTTIEIKDKVLKGVTGFGTEHNCVQWDELVNWVSKWEGYNPDPRIDIGDEDGAKPIHAGHSHGT